MLGFSSERGDDRWLYTESSDLTLESGSDGGHWLVSCQLQHGAASQVGSRSWLRLREEKLCGLDAHSTEPVRL